MHDSTERYPGKYQALSGRSRSGAAGQEPVPNVTSLRARRQQLRQTQEEAADGIGVALSTYQRWERGVMVPHCRSQRRIGDHFGVSLAVLDEWFVPGLFD